MQKVHDVIWIVSFCECFIIPFLKPDLLHESAHHILADLKYFFFSLRKLCGDYVWGFVMNFKL